MEDEAHAALRRAILNDQGWAIKLFFDHMYGKPKQVVENTNVNHNLNIDLTEEEAKAINKALEDKY